MRFATESGSLIPPWPSGELRLATARSRNEERAFSTCQVVMELLRRVNPLRSKRRSFIRVRPRDDRDLDELALVQLHASPILEKITIHHGAKVIFG